MCLYKVLSVSDSSAYLNGIKLFSIKGSSGLAEYATFSRQEEFYLDGRIDAAKANVQEAILKSRNCIAGIINRDNLNYDEASQGYSFVRNRTLRDYIQEIPEFVIPEFVGVSLKFDPSKVRFLDRQAQFEGTAFLVHPKIIITAGHVIEPFKRNHSKLACVFNFIGLDKKSFPQDDVYFAETFFNYHYSETLDVKTVPDWAVVLLDRPVQRRPILSLSPFVSGTLATYLEKSVYTWGHPCGLPMMLSMDKTIMRVSEYKKAIADLEAFAGNSGSPVFDMNHKVMAIITAGPDDFTMSFSGFIKQINYDPEKNGIICQLLIPDIIKSLRKLKTLLSDKITPFDVLDFKRLLKSSGTYPNMDLQWVKTRFDVVDRDAAPSADKILLATGPFLRSIYTTPGFKTIPSMCFSNGIDIDKSYVELALTEEGGAGVSEQKLKSSLFSARTERPDVLNHYESIHSKKEPISTEQLLKKHCQPGSRLLIEGRAGSGKSTFAKHLCCLWANGSILKKYSAVFHLSIRTLTSLPAKSYTANDLLTEGLKVYPFPGSGISPDLGSIYFTSTLGRDDVLMIVDGLDELLFLDLQLQNSMQTLLQKCKTLILTSRPYHLRILPKTDAVVELLGFGYDQVERFVHTALSSSEQSGTKEYVLRLLEQNQYIRTLSYTPVLLDLLCYVFKDIHGQSKDTVPIYSTIDIFDRIFSKIIHNLFEKNPALEKSSQEKQVIECYEELAFNGIYKGNLSLPASVVEETRLKHSLPEAAIEFGGVLRAFGKNIPGQSSYYFLHLMLQEYLAARFIARQSYEGIAKFLNTVLGKPQYNYMLLFLAGRLAKLDTGDFFDTTYKEKLVLLFKKIISYDNTGFYSFSLLMQCLNECRDEGGLYSDLNKRTGVIDIAKECVRRAVMDPTGSLRIALARRMCDCNYLISHSIVEETVLELITKPFNEKAWNDYLTSHVIAYQVAMELISKPFDDKASVCNVDETVQKSFRKSFLDESWSDCYKAILFLKETGLASPRVIEGLISIIEKPLPSLEGGLNAFLSRLENDFVSYRVSAILLLQKVASPSIIPRVTKQLKIVRQYIKDFIQMCTGKRIGPFTGQIIQVRLSNCWQLSSNLIVLLGQLGCNDEDELNIWADELTLGILSQYRAANAFALGEAGVASEHIIKNLLFFITDCFNVRHSTRAIKLGTGRTQIINPDYEFTTGSDVATTAVKAILKIEKKVPGKVAKIIRNIIQAPYVIRSLHSELCIKIAGLYMLWKIDNYHRTHTPSYTPEIDSYVTELHPKEPLLPFFTLLLKTRGSFDEIRVNDIYSQAFSFGVLFMKRFFLFLVEELGFQDELISKASLLSNKEIDVAIRAQLAQVISGRTTEVELPLLRKAFQLELDSCIAEKKANILLTYLICALCHHAKTDDTVAKALTKFTPMYFGEFSLRRSFFKFILPELNRNNLITVDVFRAVLSEIFLDPGSSSNMVQSTALALGTIDLSPFLDTLWDRVIKSLDLTTSILYLKRLPLDFLSLLHLCIKQTNLSSFFKDFTRHYEDENISCLLVIAIILKARQSYSIIKTESGSFIFIEDGKAVTFKCRPEIVKSFKEKFEILNRKMS